MFDAKRMSDELLEEEIVGIAGQIAAAMCRWLALVAEFDRRGACEAWGFQECSSWLAWRCSIAPRSAREHVRVARALAELPETQRAMARGELTYSKVRVLTRIATPDREEELVELARQATAAQLERVARTYARAMNAEDAERAHEQRFLSYAWEWDGTLSISGSLTAEEGAVFLRALEAGRERLREEGQADGGSAEPRGSIGPRGRRAPVNADALALMAESLLANGASARSGAERAQVVVHVDAGALAGDPSESVRRCELEDGAPIAPDTARRLSCDATHTRIAETPDGPRSIGRKRRTVPPAMRRELTARDGGCRFPGCTHRRWTDAHHIVHWADGGETSADNSVLLCRRHHRLVHEGGFRVEGNPGRELRFLRPDGSLIPSSPGLAAPRSRRPLPRVPGSPEPLSAGEKLDRRHALAVLAARGSPVPAA
jgi:hypothetical protein